MVKKGRAEFSDIALLPVESNLERYNIELLIPLVYQNEVEKNPGLSLIAAWVMLLF